MSILKKRVFQFAEEWNAPRSSIHRTVAFSSTDRPIFIPLVTLPNVLLTSITWEVSA